MEHKTNLSNQKWVLNFSFCEIFTFYLVSIREWELSSGSISPPKKQQQYLIAPAQTHSFRWIVSLFLFLWTNFWMIMNKTGVDNVSQINGIDAWTDLVQSYCLFVPSCRDVFKSFSKCPNHPHFVVPLVFWSQIEILYFHFLLKSVLK